MVFWAQVSVSLLASFSSVSSVFRSWFSLIKTSQLLLWLLWLLTRFSLDDVRFPTTASRWSWYASSVVWFSFNSCNWLTNSWFPLKTVETATTMIDHQTHNRKYSSATNQQSICNNTFRVITYWINSRRWAEMSELHRWLPNIRPHTYK